MRADLDNLAAALFGWLALSVGAGLVTQSVRGAVGFAVLTVIPWSLLAVQVLIGEIKVVGDSIHVRTVATRRVVRLEDLDEPVLAPSDRHLTLFLRLSGGRHLVALGSSLWGKAGVEMLASRLGARTLRRRPSGAELEREFPGSLPWADRHHWWTVAIVTAFLLVYVLWERLGS